MTDEIENAEVEEDLDLYDLLQLPHPEEEEGDDEQQEQDEEIAKQDKMDKKLSAKMDDMQKKFENTIIRDRISKFQETADSLHKDLFKAIASDVKDMESFDKAMNMVEDRAKKIKVEEEKYKAQLEKQAEEQVSRAWGTGPMGTPTPRTPDYEKDLLERVRAGDDSAAFELIIGDDWPSLVP
jgi:hypothetical protein